MELTALFHRRNPKAELRQRVERARLTPVAEAIAVPRPDTVDPFYLEEEFTARGDEQFHLHSAEGEHLALRSAALAAGLEPGSVETAYLVDTHRSVVDAALRQYLTVKAVLSPWRVRKSSLIWYGARTLGLLIGDVAGLGGAAISYGEVPVLALSQAASAGVATITAGLVGAQYRYYQLAKQRALESDSLSEELTPYLPLLNSSSMGRSFVLGVTAVGAGIALCISTGIFVLRSGIEGTASGFTFGLLALGIAAASWINSYTYADPVADAIDSARKDYTSTQRTHRKLARSWWLLLAEQTIERARVIRLEHQLRGEAARAYVEAMKREALSLSPEVVGHGVARPADAVTVTATATNGKTPIKASVRGKAS